jgi:hypothetical protein
MVMGADHVASASSCAFAVGQLPLFLENTIIVKGLRHLHPARIFGPLQGAVVTGAGSGLYLSNQN